MTAQNHILINNYVWVKAAQPTPCCREWLCRAIEKQIMYGPPLNEMQHRYTSQNSVSEGTHMMKIKRYQITFAEQYSNNSPGPEMWLRRLDAFISSQRPGFNLRTIHVSLMIATLSMWQVVHLMIPFTLSVPYTNVPYPFIQI